MTSLRDAPLRATIAVSDLARARAFYEQQLGLQPMPDDGPVADSVVMYPCGGGALLQVYTSEHAGGSGGTVASWSVDDHDALVEELRGRGVAFERYEGQEADERGVHAFGEHRVCWCKDPDGNVLAIDNGRM
jgi:catechol 2,3-dioxygenase-like lactoylglutathione lyase family enzyme